MGDKISEMTEAVKKKLGEIKTLQELQELSLQLRRHLHSLILVWAMRQTRLQPAYLEVPPLQAV